MLADRIILSPMNTMQNTHSEYKANIQPDSLQMKNSDCKIQKCKPSTIAPNRKQPLKQAERAVLGFLHNAQKTVIPSSVHVLFEDWSPYYKDDPIYILAGGKVTMPQCTQSANLCPLATM